MATEFGAQTTEAPATQNFVTPKEGIAEQPHLLQGIGQMFDQAGELFKVRKQKKSELVVASFVQRQTLVADALAQGKIRTPGQARMLTRQNFLQALDANPGLWKELSSAHSVVVGTAGIGAIITEGTAQSQLNEKRASQLVTANLLPVDHTEGEFEQADLLARNAQAASERYNESIRQIDIRLKSNTLTESERSRLENQREEESRLRLVGLAPAQMTTMTNQFDQIVGGSGSESEKTQAINDLYTGFLSGVSAQVGDLSAQQSTFLLLPFERTRDAYLQRATGELEDAELKRRMDRDSALLIALMRTDPLIAKAAAVSEMLGTEGVMALIVQDPAIAAAVFGLLAGHSGTEETIEPPTSYKPAGSVGAKAFEGYSKAILNSLASDNPELKADAALQLNSILSGMVDDEGKIKRDPKAAFGPVDWIASPNFLEAVRNNPDLFSVHQNDLIDVLERNYADEVWGLVQREFNSARVMNPEFLESVSQGEVNLDIPRDLPVTGSVTYRTTSSGMEFFSIDSSDPAGVATARDLNKTLKPRINKTVQAFSHLSGRSDYGSMWESVAKDVLSGGASGPAGGDAGDDLTLADLSTSSVNAEPLPQGSIVKFEGELSGAGFTNGRTMPSVDGMVIHHTGGRGGVSGVVNTLQDRGLSVQFVIDRDGKVHQLMADNAEAFHAGKNNDSGFDNKNTIGVEIIGNDDSDILPAQVEAAKSLIRSMSDKHGFDVSNVFGHGQVASHKRPTEGAQVISALTGDRG